MILFLKRNRFIIFFDYKYIFTNEALGRTQIEVFSFKEKSPKIHCLEISAFNSLLYNVLEFLSTYTYKSVVFHFVMVCILFSKVFLQWLLNAYTS